MGVYKRGDTYWYKFRFDGQIIRESARTNSKTIAREAERTRRRELEVGVNGLSRRERPLFATAAKDWLARKTAFRSPHQRGSRHATGDPSLLRPLGVHLRTRNHASSAVGCWTLADAK